MDTEQARTFLNVVTAGNFLAAAQRLHVTQSTVSARIQTLENQLGAKLFTRGKHGAELTAAGRRFLRHAQTLVRTVETARQDVGLPEGYSAGLTLSGRIALWEGFLPRWVAWMRTSAPTISLRLEIGFEADIMQGLIHNTIDVGVMYTPEARPGLAVERLFDETLVLVSTAPDRPWPDPGYVHVDWGPEFFHQFSVYFPDHPPPALYANIGWLGLQHLTESGGSGYFPLRMAREALQAGRLHRVKDAPAFRLPAYVVFPLTRADTFLAQAVEGLRQLARAETGEAGADGPA
ncbi:MAG: LysR family transcriptional regulator [Betaproteobacteria bacterium]|nr:LysR family transcriptional regulator [Betaproteobacteria bacterium]